MKSRRAGTGRIVAGAITLALIIGAMAMGVGFYERRQEDERRETLRTLAERRGSGRWTEENTLRLDGEIYGFDHRMETFLFIGTDARGDGVGEGGDIRGAMADFLLLMAIDHSENAYGFLQIDRNTIARVDELDREGRRINSWDEQICTANWYGSTPEMGAKNTVNAVKRLLGEMKNIDGYYVINMGDIGTLNQTVGGVEVTINDDMSAWDPALTKGRTLTLTDEQAEAYNRARVGVGNEENKDRMTRQRAYIEGYFRKVREKVAENPGFGAELWRMLRRVAVSNMNGNDFSRIAQKLLKGRDRGILTLRGESRLGHVLGDGLEHEEFYPEAGAVREAMTALFSLERTEYEEYDPEGETDDE